LHPDLIRLSAINQYRAIAILNPYVHVGVDRVKRFRNLFEHPVLRAAAAVKQHQQRSNDWANLVILRSG
jgi:hypothetical protein